MNKVIDNIKDVLAENHSEMHNYEMWETKQHMRLRVSFEEASDYINQLESKVELLKDLMILTHEKVSNIAVSETQIKQWDEYTTRFPDEKCFAEYLGEL